MNFFLLGYMGSGKSTIGKQLSAKLSYDFVDLDSYIETQENASISEIFKTKGEIYFRKIETKYLKEVSEFKIATIIALGGGTPCYGNNMEIIKNAADAKSIYLKLSIPNLVNRLFDEKGKRPLIAHITTKEALTEFIGKHLFERSAYYSESDVTITTDGLTVQEVEDKFVASLL